MNDLAKLAENNDQSIHVLLTCRGGYISRIKIINLNLKVTLQATLLYKYKYKV